MHSRNNNFIMIKEVPNINTRFIRLLNMSQFLEHRKLWLMQISLSYFILKTFFKKASEEEIKNFSLKKSTNMKRLSVLREKALCWKIFAFFDLRTKCDMNYCAFICFSKSLPYEHCKLFTKNNFLILAYHTR